MAKTGLWVVQFSPDEEDFAQRGWSLVLYRSVSEHEARRDFETRKKRLVTGSALRLARDGRERAVAYGPPAR